MNKTGDYVIEPLLRSAVINAFPLVSITMPDMEFAVWKRQAEIAIGKQGNASKGILVARRRLRPYICGMVFYRQTFDLQHGETLEASNLIAADIIDPRLIMLDLIRALGQTARRQNCSTVKLSIPENSMLSNVLQGAALEIEPHSVINRHVNISFLT